MGRSLQERTVVVAGTEVIGMQFLRVLPRFGWMLLFDITSGKTVIFLAIFTRENCTDVTYCKVIIFYFIPNPGIEAI